MPVYDSEVAFITEAKLHATHHIRVFCTDVWTILVATDRSEQYGGTCVWSRHIAAGPLGLAE